MRSTQNKHNTHRIVLSMRNTALLAETKQSKSHFYSDTLFNTRQEHFHSSIKCLLFHTKQDCGTVVVSGPNQSSSTSQMSAVVEHPVLSVVLHFVSHSCTQFLQTSFSLVWQSITTTTTSDLSQAQLFNDNLPDVFVQPTTIFGTCG